MPNVNDLKNWLKMSDLQVGDVVEIRDKGRIDQFDMTDKKTGEVKRARVLKVMVSVNGSESKELTLNSLSIDAISDKLGNATEGWADHRCEVKSCKAQHFGKMVDVNYLEPFPRNIEEKDSTKEDDTLWDEE